MHLLNYSQSLVFRANLDILVKEDTKGIVGESYDGLKEVDILW